VAVGPEKAFECVDVLFIDEAGQYVAGGCTGSVTGSQETVLLGPAATRTPMKGSIQKGGKVGAGHLLNRERRFQKIWNLSARERRLHPKFASSRRSCFYENKLGSDELARARDDGRASVGEGSGKWFVQWSMKETKFQRGISRVIAKIVEGLLSPGVEWFYSKGTRGVKKEDILIVAPYNAQVADLSARLPGMKVGTVDKFQGRKRGVIIRWRRRLLKCAAGMEFLFSLTG